MKKRYKVMNVVPLEKGVYVTARSEDRESFCFMAEYGTIEMGMVIEVELPVSGVRLRTE